MHLTRQTTRIAHPHKRRKSFLFGAALSLGALVAMFGVSTARATETAEDLWTQVEKLRMPGEMPAGPNGAKSSDEQLQTYLSTEEARLRELLDVSERLERTYPDFQHADRNRVDLAQTAYLLVSRLDDTSTSTMQIVDRVLARENLSADAAQWLYRLKIENTMNEGGANAENAFELARITNEYRTRFTDDPQAAAMHFQAIGLLESQDPQRALAFYSELAGANLGQLSAMAADAIKRLDRLGKPIDLQFTSINDKQINVATMQGKVVLLDFWATWCGPCIDALPELKSVYEQYHDQGFEVVGISLDSSEDKLREFIRKENMPWPQYFDGLGWKNEISQRFGINSIPSVWLLDKQGNLVDMNGRHNLEAKVKRLLADDPATAQAAAAN